MCSKSLDISLQLYVNVPFVSLFRIFGVTEVFLTSPLNFAREIGPWPAKIYPLAHALRLTAVLYLVGYAVHAACLSTAELNNERLRYR